jgi:hypothetical protein
MTYSELKEVVYSTAVDIASQGAGWAQERPLLNAVREKVPNGSDLKVEQSILTCWHDLFREGKLSWGYNLDNPNAPFFHVPPVDKERDSTVVDRDLRPRPKRRAV